MAKIKDMDEKDIQGETSQEWPKLRRAIENELKMIYEAEEILVAKRGRGVRWTWLSGSWKSRDLLYKSMYRFLSFRGVNSGRLKKLWKNKMPLKLKVFMWLAFQNRLQTSESEKKEIERRMRDVLFVGVKKRSIIFL